MNNKNCELWRKILLLPWLVSSFNLEGYKKISNTRSFIKRAFLREIHSVTNKAYYTEVNLHFDIGRKLIIRWQRFFGMSSLSPRQIKLRVELITTHITCNGSDTMRSSMSVWNPKPSIHSYFDIVSKLSLNIAKISLSSWLWVSIIRQIKAIIYIYIYI